MTPENLIRQPDGSYVDLKEVEPRKALAHELVIGLFPTAAELHVELSALKRLALDEMRSYREMMLHDHGVTVGGKEGNLTLRSLCGRFMIQMTVAKQVTFGEELESAKALIDEYLEQEMAKGGSEDLHDIIRDVFKVNGKGRIDTSGILGLRQHPFKDPIWQQAMDAIDEAINRDHSATYVNFFNVDPEPNAKVETRLPLNFAEVG